MGEDTVSGLMFAIDFVRISETPDKLMTETDRESTREHSRKWRVTANVETFAVVACNDDKVSPVNFKWNWGEDDLPIVDQYTYPGVETSKKGLLL